jgi:16S rRNA (uracil1498-N3)-methyltransferase
VALFDGEGHEWSARICAWEAGCLRLTLEEELVEPEVESPLPVTLYQALLRPERMDWVVQKGTELGLVSIRPFLAQQSERRAPGPKQLGRWRRIAVESCKQCGRRRLPRIEFEQRLPAAPGEGTLALLLQPGPDSRPLREVAAGRAPASILLAAGPQSGFTPEEVQAHRRAGWQPVGLGPRILRADSAGPLGAAILLHLWADLG